MKTFIAITLALTLLACDPDDSSDGGSSEPKKPATLAQCLKQVLDGQTLSTGQTKTLPYSCSIASELRNKKLVITYDQKLIQLKTAEMTIPAQDTLKGSFTLKGLEAGSFTGKIQVASYTEEFQITVQKSLAQYLKELLDGKSIGKGQTKKFPYSHPIAQDIKDKKLVITYDQKLIELKTAEMTIPAQDTLKGSFTLKGLEAGSFTGSIKIASYTEDFQFTVTKPTIPKASQFTFTQITPTLKKGSTTTANKFTYNVRKLAVHQGKLYTFENDKYFVSADGKTWTEKPRIRDGKALSMAASYLSFKNKLWGWGEDNNIFSYDDDRDTWAKNTKVLPFSHHLGSSVLFQNRAYLLLGDRGKNIIGSSSDGINWEEKYKFQGEDIKFFDAVVHEGKIWVIGGANFDGEAKPKNIPLKTVYSYDGSHWKQETDVPETRYFAGTASFAGGLIVLGGQQDNSTPRTSLIYSPYGSTWHTIIPNTADKIGGAGGDDGIKTIFDMQKWTPKTGDYANTEALWVINRDELVYRITYTEK